MDHKLLPRTTACEPTAVLLEAGKTYAWCTCGLTEKAPFCDSAHRACWTENEQGELQKHFVSLKFTAEKTEEVLLCNCKQTKTPPFCDDSHYQVTIENKL